jgi:phospholipid transport system substrate-binding protein
MREYPMILPGLTRRRLLAPLALAALLPPAARAGEEEAGAAGFIRRAGKELADLVNGAHSAAEKRRRLQPFIDRVVDVDAVGRFCLGRHWRQATAAQQQEYLREFHGILLNNVVARMGDYQNTTVNVTIGQADAREDGVHVPTVVERSGQPPARVTWVVRDAGAGPRIVDVMAEGTSLRLPVRSDYAAFLANHGDSIDALIAAMRQQNAQFAG